MEQDVLRQRVESLGPWWEQIDFAPGIKTGAGRNKSLLWKKYLQPVLPAELFAGKAVLDMACNAGGNLLELSRFKPSRLVGIDANRKFLAQAELVRDYFEIPCELREYRFSPTSDWNDYQRDLGQFDFIFCLGLIYHLNRETNLQILEYGRRNSGRMFGSTQLLGLDERPGVDWEVSRDGTIELARSAGFRGVRDLYLKSATDDWSGLTNQWYFEFVS